MSYGVKYSIPFVDDYGQDFRTDILELNFAGDSTELTPARPALTIETVDTTDSKIAEFRPQKATVGIVTTSSGFRLSSLYSENGEQFQIKVYKGAGLIFSGWIDPFDSKEDFTDAPYTVSVSATDGISRLKTRPFIEFGTGLSIGGRRTFKSIIATCLQWTGLGLPFTTGTNTYEYEETQGTDEDPLAQTYIDTAVFRSDGLPFSCYDVLKNICITYNLELVQANGQWWILNTFERTGAYHVRNYDSAGTFVDSELFNPTVNFGRGQTLKPLAGASEGVDRPLNKVETYLQYSELVSLASNGSFSEVDGNGDVIGWTGTATKERTGAGTEELPYAVEIAGNGFDGPTIFSQPDNNFLESAEFISTPDSYVDISLKTVGLGVNRAKIAIIGRNPDTNAVQYLTRDGLWTPNLTTIRIETINIVNLASWGATEYKTRTPKIGAFTRLKIRLYRGFVDSGTPTDPKIRYWDVKGQPAQESELRTPIGALFIGVGNVTAQNSAEQVGTVIGPSPSDFLFLSQPYKSNATDRARFFEGVGNALEGAYDLLTVQVRQRASLYTMPYALYDGGTVGGFYSLKDTLIWTNNSNKRLLILRYRFDFSSRQSSLYAVTIEDPDTYTNYSANLVYEGDKVVKVNVAVGGSITGIPSAVTNTTTTQPDTPQEGAASSIREVTLSEDLPAGAYVHLVQGEDVVNAYGAIANNTGRWAHGFIKVAGVAGDVVMAYGTGHVNESTVVQIGADWDTRDFDDSDWLTNLESDIIAGVHYYLSPTDKGKVTPVLPYSGAIQLVGQGVQRGGLQFVYHEAAAYSGTGDGVRFFTHNTDGELEYKLFNYQPFSQRLTDIADNLQANGFLAYVDETYTIEARSITGIEGEIVVANGNGVGANPEIGLAESGVTPTETDGFTVDSKGRVTAIDAVEVANWSQAHDDNVIAASVSDFGTNAKVLMLTKRSLEQYESAPFSFPINTGQASSLVSSDTGNIGSIWYTDRSVFFRNSSNQTIELKQIAEPVAEEPTALARTGVDFSYNYALSNIQTSLPSTISMISWPDWTNEPTIGANSILISALSAEIPNKPGRTYPVVFRVTNGDGQSRTFTIRIQISDTATAPTVANAIPDQTGTVGTLFQYTIPSNTFLATTGHSIIQFSASVPTGAGWLVYDSATRKFTGTPPSAQTLQIAVVGTDTQGLSITDIFLITVSTGSANDPIPAVYDVADSNFTTVLSDGTVGQHVVNDNISAWDVSAPVDGSYRVTVIYRWGGDDMGYQVDSKVGTWSAISTTGVGPTNTALTQFDISLLTGAHTIYFRGTGDTSAFYNIQSVTIQLIQGGTNIAPRIANQPPTLTGRQNIAFDATLTSPIFVDDDGTVVSITASGLPTGLSYSNGRITGTPTGSGSSVVTLTATDDDAATSTTQFLIIINAEVVISTGTTEVFATFSF